MVMRALPIGLVIHQYLDDWLLRDMSPVALSSKLTAFLKLVSRLGLLVNWKKSELIPAQDFVFVGYRYRTDLALVLPSLSAGPSFWQPSGFFFKIGVLQRRLGLRSSASWP